LFIFVLLRPTYKKTCVTTYKAIIHYGVVPSERNPVRTKAVFDLMEHRFSFCRDFVLMGFRSIGTAFCRGDIQRCRYSCTLSSFLTYLTLRGGGGTRPAICANTFSVPPCWRPICSSQYPAGPALAVVRFHLLFYHSVSLFVLF